MKNQIALRTKHFVCIYLAALTLAGQPVHAARKVSDAPSVAMGSNQKKKKKGKVHYGIASYYGVKFKGKKTSSGEHFDPEKLTAACNIIPLRTWVRITNVRNGRTVVLKITDHMHPKNKRLIDVSASAAKELGFYRRGLAKVKVEIVEKRSTAAL